MENTKPLIYAKAAMKHEQIKTKLSIGCDGIEIQLLNELIINRLGGEYSKPEDTFKLHEFDKYPIHVIHSPLVSGVGDILLEAVCDEKDVSILDSTFRIANYFGELQNRKVIVVIHSETFYENISDIGCSWRNILVTIDGMLNKYPYTEIVIENVSPLRGIGKGKELHLSNNFAFDNVQMVKRLREEIGTDRIGTCLDTCHMMLTQKYITGLYEMVGDIPVPDLSTMGFFEANAPYVKLFHFADMFGSGYGKGRHGIPFKPETKNKLEELCNMYKHFDLTCPITLEVEETDFTVCDGYKTTKQLIDEIL